jgi:hypothetical protein
MHTNYPEMIVERHKYDVYKSTKYIYNNQIVLYQKQAELERIRQETIKQEALKQEYIRQETIRQQAIRQEVINKRIIEANKRETDKLNIPEIKKNESNPLSDQDECKICMEYTQNAVIVPCGHMLCFEGKCKDEIKVCHMCRRPIEKIIKMHKC